MAKQIKLVAVDLDRTILRSDGTLSSFTEKVFHRLRSCQISVCVLTARRKTSAEKFCAQLACRGAAFYNGAVVTADKSLIAQYPMNWQSAKRLLSDTEGYPASVSCENDTVYTNFETQHSVRLESWEQLVKQNLLRIVLYKAPQKLLKRLAVTSYSGLYIQPLEHSDILAVSQSATKEQALKTLLEYWKLTSEEVIGFGDDINDLGFLALVGTGIAVQNAEEQVRQRADIVCGRNDEDGPALWLNEYVLKPLNATVL